MKKTHKLLAVVLSVIMILSVITVIPFTAFAETEEIFEYSVEYSQVTITKLVNKNTTGEIAIPSTIGGHPVTSIDDWAFYDCKGLTSVTIPDSVTSIGEWAFGGCTGLITVAIGNSVTSIGKEAFSGCTGLTSITIPNNVTSIGGYAFCNCAGLTSVAIGNSVTYIGYAAFKNCSGLTSIIIPDSVASIGGEAFSCCTGLTSITMPDSVTSIGEEAFLNTGYYKNRNNWETGALYIENYLIKAEQYISGEYIIKSGTKTIAGEAFYGCAGLTSITIPDSVTSIGYWVFRDCSGLTSVTIGNSVTSIGKEAFEGCTGLTSITIPNSITSIGHGAFSNCTALTSVTIPDSVTSIGEWAFGGCTGLTSVVIPDSVASIGDRAFYDCTGLTSVTIGNSATIIDCSYVFDNCSIKNLIIAEGSKTVTSTKTISKSKLENITIPNSVTSIGCFAFSGCTGLTSVTIPDSVTSIGERAFYNTPWYNNQSDGLVYAGKVAYKYKGTCPESVIIKAGTLGIAAEAFKGCKGLTSVTIPDSVTSIGEWAFRDCTGLTSVTIGDSVTSIGDEAFYGCEGLTSVTIPDSVTSIGDRAFYKCFRLTSITIGNSVTSIGDDAFHRCFRLTSVTIGNSVTSIGDRAFYDCTGLISVTIGDSVTSIGEEAFTSCSGLTSIIIPDSVTSIGDSAFSHCWRLTSVTIGNSVTSIGEEAFYNTPWYNNQPDGLVYAGKVAYKYKGTCPESVIIKAGTLGIAAEAFKGCKGLTSVTIPDSVTSIGDEAFKNCTGLTSVTIGDSVTSIGEEAFYGCEGLTSVTIPDSVTSIGKEAFEGCTGLTSVTIGDSVTSIGDEAFYGCEGLTSVTIPDSVTSIGKEAFEGCTGLKSITIPNSATLIGVKAFDGCNIKDVYYIGTMQQMNPKIYGYYFKRATWHYNYVPEAPVYTQESLSGTIRTGDTWSLNWRVDYQEDSFGNKSDYKLSIYLSGADKSNDSIMMYSLLGNGFLMPWLTEEYGFSKSDFTSITVTGGNANPLEIISDQFSGYTSVKTVKLSRVRIIQGRAFEGCTSLQTVDYDRFLKLVGPSAFKNDRNLQYFSTSAFVSNIEDIGDEAFLNTKLNSILLTNCQSIGESAFSNTPIGDITLPRCVRNIGENAFLGCDNLTILCYKNSCAHKYSLEYDIRYVLFDPELEDYLGMDSSIYYNDLAVIAAEMSLATGGGSSEVEDYLRDLDFKDENIYSNNYGGSLAFTVATKTYGKSSDNQDILVIIARGSTNIYELFNDSFSPADQSYDGYKVYGIVNDFKNAINEGLDKVRKSGKNYKVLVTGHSLGGAAANLVGAQMTKQYGRNNVFCYTFGAINSIVSSKPISTGYENIHNIYNDLDTFSPYQYGRIMKNGAGTKYGKFGHLDVFVKENRSEADKQKPPIVQECDYINHDMKNYLSAVRSGIVQNSYLRSCRNKTNRYSIVACPVDVEVYCENKLVGKVTYNEIDESLSGVDIFVEGDVKVIIYPDDKTYDLKINAFDDGDMLYINQNSEVAENKLAINCENIQKGKEFSSHINSNLETNAIKLYTNDENSNQTIGITQDSTTYILGDISGDGSLNNGDLVTLFQYLSGWNVEVNESALDINGDGKENNQDLVLLFQFLSGWNVEIF